MAKRKNHGFTLIELLIAIGILGILASALLATINPIEQISKSQDTSLSTVSTEFLNASSRYYLTNNASPWQSTVEGGSNCYSTGSTFTAVPLSSMTNCLNTFIAAGELKQSFLNTNNLNTLFVTSPNPNTGSTTEPIVCYLPRSQKEQLSANTRYNQNGTPATSCKSQGGTMNCYTCYPPSAAVAVAPTSGIPAVPTSVATQPAPTTPPVQPTEITVATPTPQASSSNYSLRFFGAQANDIDRVKMLLTPNKTIDVSGNFTIEWWMKTGTGNTGGTCTSGAAGVGDYDWITGNVLFDRDIDAAGDYGKYGISLIPSEGGKISFGVAVGSSKSNLCSTTTVANGAWHHVAATRNGTTGQICLYVNGAANGCKAGPTGDISYRDARTAGMPNDPYFVIGAEKHDYAAANTGFKGWIDEVRVSNNIRYTASFSRPTGPYTVDGNTVALYHFDSNTGTTVTDATGANNGILRVGGASNGPQWSTDKPF
jgi:prepilin-type N-terminal cleavage/methylation domain-containing protein